MFLIFFHREMSNFITTCHATPTTLITEDDGIIFDEGVSVVSIQSPHASPTVDFSEEELLDIQIKDIKGQIMHFRACRSLLKAEQSKIEKAKVKVDKVKCKVDRIKRKKMRETPTKVTSDSEFERDLALMFPEVPMVD
jgi:hypothetical protein